MSGFAVILLVAIGFAVSWLAVPLIQERLRFSDRRQLHHTHGTPISRFGGLAIVVPFLMTAIIGWVAFPALGRGQEHVVVALASVAMFILGFVDDVRPLGAKRKLLAQVFIATAVYVAGVQIGQFRNPFTGSDVVLGVWSYVATVLWLVSFTNLINLIDGVDGLAAGISLMVMSLLLRVCLASGLFLPTACAASVCGALIAFLRYNFPPARIYLGDGGAYFLGFVIGSLAMVNSQKGTVAAALIAPLFPLALPIVDTTLAILRRGLKGLPVFRPDRSHLHHRLAELGLSRTRVVLMFYGCSLFFLALGFVVELSHGRWIPLTMGLTCMVLLISAGSFRFSREWFAVGRVLGNSLETRKETRYALALGRWLELEAERAQTRQNLWCDFEFLVKKLGFCEIALIDAGRWVGAESRAQARGQRYVCRRVLPSGDALELQASTALSPEMVELMAELATEIWVKSLARWDRLNPRKLQAEITRAEATVLPLRRVEPEAP